MASERLSLESYSAHDVLSRDLIGLSATWTVTWTITERRDVLAATNIKSKATASHQHLFFFTEWKVTSIQPNSTVTFYNWAWRHSSGDESQRESSQDTLPDGAAQDLPFS